MLIRSRTVNTTTLPRHMQAGDGLKAQPERRLGPVSLVGMMCACMAVLVLAVMAVARTGEVAYVPDLPERLLPGQALPNNVACYTLSDEPTPRCSVDVAGSKIYFEFEAGTRTITRTLIPAQQYQIGDMILAWGTPTGVTRRDTLLYVHWWTRSALVYTREFRPDSRVEMILYDLEPLTSSPWRGFQLHRRAGT